MIVAAADPGPRVLEIGVGVLAEIVTVDEIVAVAGAELVPRTLVFWGGGLQSARSFSSASGGRAEALRGLKSASLFLQQPQ